MVTVYGKPGCGRCDAAKEKLERMAIPYATVDITTHPADWRDCGMVDAMATHCLTGTLPVIRIGERFMDYPEAMKELKTTRQQGRA
jgi:glutaredoxin